MSIEEKAIAQLQRYQWLSARIHVLETYSISGGILLSTILEDDRLQELHRKLRGKRSYMYLNQYELQVEQTAHAYLERYPAGTRAQLAEVRQCRSDDPDDEKLLRELEQKIQKVIESRGGGMVYGFEDVLDRISQIQDFQQEQEQIEGVLEALEGYRPEYAKLLRLQYIENQPIGIAAGELGVVRKTFERWRPKALYEYARLAGMS